MDYDFDVLAELLRAELVNAGAIHAEALAKAQAAQMHTTVVSALKEVLSDDGGSPLLIKQIPFICTDITKIKSDMIWIRWLVMGMAAEVGYIIVNLITHSLK